MTTPITPIHDPWCGYWFKSQRGGGPRPGPPEPPVPVPIPTPPPNPDTCMGCWGPQQTMRYCPSGSDINVSPGIICGLDPIVSASIYSGDGSVSLSGSIAVFNPGTGGPVIIQFDTRSGDHCYVWLMPNPPEDCCGAETLIGYTSTGMSVGTQQQLTIINANELSTYTFEIISGPGSITSDGLYTAPDANPGCPPAVIGLFCNGVQKDQISISINAISGNAGYYVYSSKFSYWEGYCGDCYCQMLKKNVSCYGYIGEVYAGCSNTQQAQECPYANCTELWPGLCEAAGGDCVGICVEYGCTEGYHDTRTQEQIDQGCCPPQFM
jgi:hypothetical protein